MDDFEKMPNDLKSASHQQLHQIREFMNDLTVIGLWPFVDSREKILADIDREIASRSEQSRSE